jgi:hypothetical protein
MNDPSHLFTLRVKLGGGIATIHAYEAGRTGPHHTKVELELRHGGETIFPRAGSYVGIPGHETIDGDGAKRCALGLFALKPGDTDAEFFERYTPEQLEFVRTWGEELSMIAEERYGED